MTKKQVAQKINSMLAGKLGVSAETMADIVTYATEKNVSLVSLIPEGKEAIAKQIGLLPLTPAEKKAQEKKQAREQAQKEKQAQELAKQEENRAKIEKLNQTIKDNTSVYPATLFRLAWKEGKKITGIDVFAVYPILKTGKLHVVGRMLKWDGEKLQPIDNLSCFEVDQIKVVNNQLFVTDSEGLNLPLSVAFPKPQTEDKPKQNRPKKPAKPAEKEDKQTSEDTKPVEKTE